LKALDTTLEYSKKYIKDVVASKKKNYIFSKLGVIGKCGRKDIEKAQFFFETRALIRTSWMLKILML
jgi:hypothetical protein